MSVQELSEYTRISKYARYLPELGRRETAAEQVDRVMQMHRTKYADIWTADLQEEWDLAYSLMLENRFTGSQRAQQFGGEPILRKEGRLWNCITSYCDRPRFFQEALWLLLCGCGVGFSVQLHHIERLPPICAPVGTSVTYTVPDSIEGWAESLGVLMRSYFHVHAHPVEFDFSQIREAGAALSWGGVAPGPKALQRSLELIRTLLNKVCLRNPQGQVKLKPIECYDIIMHASDAVLSGGVRRSATICLFSPEDNEMMTAKTGNWRAINPQRARSNNSALLIRGETSWELFLSIIESTKDCGEPGYVWSWNREFLVNPCVEAGFRPYWESDADTIVWQDEYDNEIIEHPAFQRDGQNFYSGWQSCNLSEINGLLATSPQRFYEACRSAAFIGTLQAGYTNFKYLGPVSKLITDREGLLGVSITGIMDHPDLLLNPIVLRTGMAIIRATNERWALAIGVNPAARLGAIKPSGTYSCICGSASGVHLHHCRNRYFRLQQSNVNETPLDYFRSINPDAVEPSVWDPNGLTDVITFLCEPPSDALTKEDMTAIEFLDKIKILIEHWIIPGTVVERCVEPWLSHNVSNTVSVKPDEWELVAQYIFDNQNLFAGVSLMHASGDLDWEQAPFCKVRTWSEMTLEYGEACFDKSLYWFIDEAIRLWGSLWVASDTAMGFGAWTQDADFLAEQQVWVANVNETIKNLNMPLKTFTYMLKDLYLINKWEKLEVSFKPTDWTQFIEYVDTTHLDQEAGCAGGACEIPQDVLDAMREAASKEAD